MGPRIRELRVRLGSKRKELSYQGLADEIADATGLRLTAGALRLYELGEREPSQRIVEAIAAVDPLQRGPWWLQYGVTASPGPDAPTPQRGLSAVGIAKLAQPPKSVGKRRA